MHTSAARSTLAVHSRAQWPSAPHAKQTFLRLLPSLAPPPLPPPPERSLRKNRNNASFPCERCLGTQSGMHGSTGLPWPTKQALGH